MRASRAKLVLALASVTLSCGRIGFDPVGECDSCTSELACVNAACVDGKCVRTADPGTCGIDTACVPTGTVGGVADCGVCDPGRAFTEWSRLESCEFLAHGRLFVGDVAGDRLGTDVAISGDVVIAGAPFADGSGKVWIFERIIGGAWRFHSKHEAGDTAMGDELGTAVAIDGATFVVGAPFADHSDHVDAGAVYVFERDGFGWSQTAKLVASDADGSDYFGIDVAIDGDRVVIGSYYDDDPSESGAAYVFERNAGTWSETAKLRAPTPADRAFFGSSVAIDGDRIVVGAPYETIAAESQGAAYVFEYLGPGWSAGLLLSSGSPEPSEFFGYGVAIEGDWLAIGAAQDNAVAIDGGAVHVFQRNGAEWLPHAVLTGPDQSSQYGRSPAMQGGRIAVGGLYLDGSGSLVDAGAAYVYRQVALDFQPGEPMHAEFEAEGARFGASVDLDGAWMVVSADSADGERGAIDLFEIAP